jgi:hypothetical protein
VEDLCILLLHLPFWYRNRGPDFQDTVCPGNYWKEKADSLTTAYKDIDASREIFFLMT